MKNRLSKILAASGVASRRASEELIFSGKVAVNGQVTFMPQTMVDPAIDRITVNGKGIKLEEKKVYFLVNKPIGYICTSLEKKGGGKKGPRSLCSPSLSALYSRKARSTDLWSDHCHK